MRRRGGHDHLEGAPGARVGAFGNLQFAHASQNVLVGLLFGLQVVFQDAVGVRNLIQAFQLLGGLRNLLFHELQAHRRFLRLRLNGDEAVFRLIHDRLIHLGDHLTLRLHRAVRGTVILQRLHQGGLRLKPRGLEARQGRIADRFRNGIQTQSAALPLVNRRHRALRVRDRFLRVHQRLVQGRETRHQEVVFRLHGEHVVKLLEIVQLRDRFKALALHVDEFVPELLQAALRKPSGALARVVDVFVGEVIRHLGRKARIGILEADVHQARVRNLLHFDEVRELCQGLAGVQKLGLLRKVKLFVEPREDVIRGHQLHLRVDEVAP